MNARLLLGEIAGIQIGYQAKGSIGDDPQGTHLLIQSRDCRPDGEILWRTLCRIRPERESARYLVRDGDVLFLAKGGRRTAAAVRGPEPHTLAVSTFFILRLPSEDLVLPEYLAWYLNTAAREYLTAAAAGTTIPFVSAPALAQMEIRVPPVSTQRTIAGLDRLLNRERQLTATLLDKRAQLAAMLSMQAATGRKA